LRIPAKVITDSGQSDHLKNITHWV